MRTGGLGQPDRIEHCDRCNDAENEFAAGAAHAGNIVFGFAIAAVPGFSLAASVAALGGFLVGAFIGGAMIDAFGKHRGVLRNACGLEFVLVAVARIVTIMADDDESRYRISPPRC